MLGSRLRYRALGVAQWLMVLELFWEAVRKKFQKYTQTKVFKD